jgi:hypothetical protein
MIASAKEHCEHGLVRANLQRRVLKIRDSYSCVMCRTVAFITDKSVRVTNRYVTNLCER